MTAAGPTRQAQPSRAGDVVSGPSPDTSLDHLFRKRHQMAQQLDALGPISYLIVEFPGNKMTGNGLPILVDLVDRGVIRILDLLFVMRDDNGTVNVVEVADFDSDGSLDLAAFQGASSGLLDESDINEAGSVIEPGSAAGILIFENSWAAPFVRELRKGGAQLVSAGYIPQDDILSALDAADAR